MSNQYRVDITMPTDKSFSPYEYKETIEADDVEDAVEKAFIDLLVSQNYTDDEIADMRDDFFDTVRFTPRLGATILFKFVARTGFVSIGGEVEQL